MQQHCIALSEINTKAIYFTIPFVWHSRKGKKQTNKQTNKKTKKKNTTTKHSSGTGDWGRELNAEEALGKAVYGNVLYVDYGGSCMT